MMKGETTPHYMSWLITSTMVFTSTYINHQPQNQGTSEPAQAAPGRCFLGDFGSHTHTLNVAGAGLTYRSDEAGDGRGLGR